MFRRLDKDRSWTLSKEELSRGVGQFGLDLSDGDINKLFSSFEKDGQSGINYEEFLESLRVRKNDCKLKNEYRESAEMEKWKNIKGSTEWPIHNFRLIIHMYFVAMCHCI